VARRLLAVLAVAALAAVVLALRAGGGEDGSEDTPEGQGRADVVRVVDGDTIVVRLDGREESVRLIGIDTPESIDPRTPVECYGREASRRAAALLPPGTAVRLVRDVEPRDRYDRLLAYVYRLDDGTFVNLALVQEGFASVATYPPNVAHTDDFVAAAADAREAGRGLWQACGDPDDGG
jgi:micrococcal nuclease